MPPEYFFPILGMGFALAWGVIGTARWYLKERLDAEAKRGALGGADVHPANQAEHIRTRRTRANRRTVDCALIVLSPPNG